MTTSSITLPLTEALMAFKSVLPHASTDPVTPIITTLNVVGDANTGKTYLVATDRFTIGRYELSAPIATGDGYGFHIPWAAASWITRLTAGVLRYGKNSIDDYRVKIRQDVSKENKYIRTVTIGLVHKDKTTEQMRVFDGVGGNFPPVVRLFPDETTELGVTHIALAPHFIERIARSIKAASEMPYEPGKFTFLASKGKKPQPVLVEVGKLAMLVQPNIDPQYNG